ncbi:MAG: GNAT family N-acetyltransferase [Pirellulaceae bacterium]|jgi:GNAT superfamily N-acetyltransferase|nr:GNAT family N-acetyltransferase [Pirellulaceae bacterium]
MSEHVGYYLRQMSSDDREEVSRLIFHSTNRYYVSIGREPIFKGDDLAAADIFDVYERIDPGEGIVAVDDQSRKIIGSCFVHPRETHISLGIMNAHPDHFGRGVARAILVSIIDRARTADKPVRLVSSCFNLDSYSLYTRSGFVPFETFQDMFVEVPEGGLPHGPPNDLAVRSATVADVDEMASLERRISGISRISDYRYFIRNDDNLWRVSIVESSRGIDGFLVSCGSNALNMIGPGVASTQDQAAALFYDQLSHQQGRCPVLLVPVSCGDLVRQLYDWGARNCEMHVAQSYGSAQNPAGVVMPTFLPESA